MANNIINLRNLLISFSSFLLNYINKRLFIKLHLPQLLILVTPFTTRAMMSQIFVLKTLSGELRGTLLFLNGGDGRDRTFDTRINSPSFYRWTTPPHKSPLGKRTAHPFYLPHLLSEVAGMAGFEPTNARVKVLCLTTWRHPYIFLQDTFWYYNLKDCSKISCCMCLYFF